jgi:hypothetical protein
MTSKATVTPAGRQRDLRTQLKGQPKVDGIIQSDQEYVEHPIHL